MDHERRKHCSMNPFLTPLCETVGSNVRICDVHPSLSKRLRNHQFLLPFPAATSTWPSYSRWCKTSPGMGGLVGRTESKARRADFFFLYPSDKFGGVLSSLRSFLGSAREMMLGKRWRNIFIRSTCEEVPLCPHTWQGKCILGSWPLLPDCRLCINLCISVPFCCWAVHRAEGLQGERRHGFEFGLENQTTAVVCSSRRSTAFKKLKEKNNPS